MNGCSRLEGKYNGHNKNLLLSKDLALELGGIERVAMLRKGQLNFMPLLVKN